MDLDNHSCSTVTAATTHPLSMLADTPPSKYKNLHTVILLPEMDVSLSTLTTLLLHDNRATLLRYVDVYIKICLPSAGGEGTDRRRVRENIFSSIDQVFQPSYMKYRIWKEPDYLRKVSKGYSAWTSRKRIIGWVLNSLDLTISLLTLRLHKVHAALEEFPVTHRHNSRQKWDILDGILHVIAPALLGGGSQFYHP